MVTSLLFAFQGLTEQGCMRILHQHAGLSYILQTTTSHSWDLRNCIHLMQGNGEKSSIS